MKEHNMSTFELEKIGKGFSQDDEKHSKTSLTERAPFSHEKLNEIFEVSSKHPDRLIARESSIIEFKESFGWKSLAKYLKTCAAFANTRGGYIIFGIGQRPHKLLGLMGSNLKMFESIDPEILSSHFNEYFSPELIWNIHQYELNTKSFGILYISECICKPVICKKEAAGILREGDIYYRYRGRSERIKYPELRNILEQKRENEQKLWMQHIAQIARIGVQEAGIFDLKTGLVTGTAGAFIIDESLLSQLSFIKEGEFSETKGKATLKLIGSVESRPGIISTINTKKILKTKGIWISDIVLSFLNCSTVEDPLEYAKQICYESTSLLPVYYYMHLAKISKKKLLEILDEVITRNPSKDRLKERIELEKVQKMEEPKGDKPSTRAKMLFLTQLKSAKININIQDKELDYCLQAIRYLSKDEILKRRKYLCKILKLWFNKHYSSGKANIADQLRRSICWVDEALYMKNK